MDYDKEIKEVEAQIERAKIEVYHLEGALAMLQWLKAQKDKKDEIPTQEG